MAAGLKKFYKKSYTVKKFEKKILGKLFLKDERELILSVYGKKEDSYVLTEPDNPDTIKKLNKLISVIKKNSGALGIGKIGSLAALVISFTVFTVFFQNPLAEKGMEKGLEKIFKAESEVTGLRLSLFSGLIRYKSMQVADREDPERNLFQTGEAVIDLDMSEILKGKFAAEEIKLEDFAMGEKRAVRAKALAGTVKKEKADSGPASSDILKDTVAAAGRLPDNLIPDRETVKKVISENTDKLSAPKAAEKIAADLKGGAENIRSGINKTESDIKQLEKDVNEISSARLSSKLDLAGAKKIADRIKSASSRVSSLSANIASSRKEIDNLKKTAADGKKNLEKAVSGDIEYIISLFPGKGSFSVSSFARPLVQEKLDPFMKKYGNAYEIFLKIKESGDKKKAESAPPASEVKRGRDIRYTVYGSPSLHIRKVSGSFFTDGNRHSLEIRDITNNQELAGKPLVFMVRSGIDNIETEAEGFFDTRKSAADFSGIKIAVKGGKLSNLSFLSPAGIDKLSADMDIAAAAAISADKNFKGTAGISLEKFRMNTTSQTGKIISGIIEKENRIDFQAVFSSGGGDVSLKIKSSLDNLIAKAVSPEKIAADVKSYAVEELAAVLKEKSGLQEDAERQIEELTGKIGSLEKAINEQKKELEQKLKSLPIKL
ncbi:MAG: TIGR03545 family protein [Spirochaetales bacterium]|nr:TIGR03545 family protein [Spirochaetales bacterium]